MFPRSRRSSRSSRSDSDRMKLPSCVQDISCQPRRPFESGLHASPLVASNCMANVSDVALRRGPSAPDSAEGCHSDSTRPLAASIVNPPPPTSKSPGLSFVAGLAEANFCTTTYGPNACHSRRADFGHAPRLHPPPCHRPTRGASPSQADSSRTRPERAIRPPLRPKDGTLT